MNYPQARSFKKDILPILNKALKNIKEPERLHIIKMCRRWFSIRRRKNWSVRIKSNDDLYTNNLFVLEAYASINNQVNIIDANRVFIFNALSKDYDIEKYLKSLEIFPQAVEYVSKFKNIRYVNIPPKAFKKGKLYSLSVMSDSISGYNFNNIKPFNIKNYNLFYKKNINYLNSVFGACGSYPAIISENTEKIISKLNPQILPKEVIPDYVILDLRSLNNIEGDFMLLEAYNYESKHRLETCLRNLAKMSYSNKSQTRKNIIPYFYFWQAHDIIKFSELKSENEKKLFIPEVQAYCLGDPLVSMDGLIFNVNPNGKIIGTDHIEYITEKLSNYVFKTKNWNKYLFNLSMFIKNYYYLQ